MKKEINKDDLKLTSIGITPMLRNVLQSLKTHQRQSYEEVIWSLIDKKK